MEIKIDIDKCLSLSQQDEIKTHLSSVCARDPLVAFSEAAIAEFADALFSRRQESASITPQQRLYHLIKHGLDGAIPSEQIVSRLFGIPEKRATSRIENVASKYRTEFQPGFIAAIADAFKVKDQVERDGVTIYQFNAPQVVINFLKEEIGSLASGKLTPIEKAKGSAEVYEITSDTYKAVCKSLKIKA